MAPTVVAFDVYGTLVDPLGIRNELGLCMDETSADQVATLWRRMQIEYAFRRALMGAYENFRVCTDQALRFACQASGIELHPDQICRLMDAYLHLPVFPDVRPGIEDLRAMGVRVVAFSNGVEQDVRQILTNSGLNASFDDVISMNDLRTFKPDPSVYYYLVRRGGADRLRTWLVSANGWDVIGAKHAGIRSIWLDRTRTAFLDPWNIEPDRRVAAIGELSLSGLLD